MRVLLRYHYFQPADGRYRHPHGSTDGGRRNLALIYSGVIPTEAEEPTEEILERLFLRHSTELRPDPRQARPIGVGDVLELVGRGPWQVLPSGFRPLDCDRIVPAPVN